TSGNSSRRSSTPWRPKRDSSLSSAPRDGGAKPSTTRAASTCRRLVAVTSETCSRTHHRLPHGEPAPPQPPDWSLGHRRRRTSRPPRRADLPTAAGGVRSPPPLPVLPRQRGGHSPGAGDLWTRGRLVGAG